ncbi:MAG: hypothetical protein ACREA9_28800 [Pyrinomonadaceae bacterium]
MTLSEATDHAFMVWNDTETPLAYFISFRSYGTWLHGDKPGLDRPLPQSLQVAIHGPKRDLARLQSAALKNQALDLEGRPPQMDRSRNSRNMRYSKVVVRRDQCTY